MDINGTFLDTVQVNTFRIVAMPNDHFLFQQSSGDARLYKYDENLDLVQEIDLGFGDEIKAIYSYQYTSSNTLVWNNLGSGIFSTANSTPVSNSRSLLYDNQKDCRRSSARTLSISPDGSKLLVQIHKLEHENGNPCKVWMWDEIHLMNIDGTNDVKLELP